MQYARSPFQNLTLPPTHRNLITTSISFHNRHLHPQPRTDNQTLGKGILLDLRIKIKIFLDPRTYDPSPFSQLTSSGPTTIPNRTALNLLGTASVTAKSEGKAAHRESAAVGPKAPVQRLIPRGQGKRCGGREGGVAVKVRSKAFLHSHTKGRACHWLFPKECRLDKLCQDPPPSSLPHPSSSCQLGRPMWLWV